MEVNKDIDTYTCFKYLFILNRMCGMVFYTVKGPVGNRDVSMPKENYVYISFHCTLFICCFYWLILKDLEKDKFGWDAVPRYAVFISYLILYIGIFISQFFFNSLYIWIYKKYEKLANILTLDFKKIRNFCNFLLISKLILLVLIFVNYCLMIGIEYSYHYNAFHFFCEFSEILISIQASIMLYGTKIMAMNINSKFKQLYFLDEIRGKRIMKLLLDIHFDLYKICVRGNNLFSYLTVKLFGILAFLVYFMYKIVVGLDENTSFFFTYNLILWNLHNISNAYIIIWSAEGSRTEVRHVLFR